MRMAKADAAGLKQVLDHELLVQVNGQHDADLIQPGAIRFRAGSRIGRTPLSRRVLNGAYAQRLQGRAISRGWRGAVGCWVEATEMRLLRRILPRVAAAPIPCSGIMRMRGSFSAMPNSMG